MFFPGQIQINLSLVIKQPADRFEALPVGLLSRFSPFIAGGYPLVIIII
jgi:hypothetical protein